MAAWLSGAGKLIFDDEPDKYYEAKVYEAIAIEHMLRKITVQVVFECKPFALNNAQMNVYQINEQGQQISLNIAGNQKTCGTIILTNTGETTINSFSIRRERLR